MTKLSNAKSRVGETSDAEPRQLSPLTPRQRQIAILLAQGYRRREVAALLAVNKRLVKRHKREVFRKLGVFNRRQLTVYIGDRASFSC